MRKRGDSDALSTMDLGLPGDRRGSAVPDCVADRYQVGPIIGAGGAGQVYQATDTLTGQPVAIKWLHGSSAEHQARVRREVTALRALRLPGVVKLLDEGIEEGHRYIVMELVEGLAFPGCSTPASWEALQETVFALLEILVRVHQAGVVHRDLKPANVLVRADRRPVILDFGLARGEGVGQTITRSGVVMGTPRYQAPEQVLGDPADARADIYAVGVMIFEALTGRPPHASGSVEEILRARVERSATPIGELVHTVPRSVGSAIDRMLSRRPEDRFSTALEALSALRGEGAESDLARRLPRLGDPFPVRAVVEAALAGRSIDLSGPPGSGRTRCLREAAAILEAKGRRVHFLLRGRAPYESVKPLVSELADDDVSDVGLRAMHEHLRRHLARVLAEGQVVMVDNREAVDRWSARVIDDLRSQGAVVQALLDAEDADLRLGPLSEEELRPLFRGPDRVLHLREDAACELWRRTEGVPVRVDAEVGAWVRAGVARWEGQELVVDRASLDSMRGWFQPSPTGLDLRPPNSRLTQQQEELLAWVHLAQPYATVALIRAASGKPAWHVEAELEELERAGAVRIAADGRVQARVPSLALQLWEATARQAAHLVLARLLPAGARGRLFHLVVAGATDEVVPEAVAVARRATKEGRLGDALAVLQPALAVVRDAIDDRGESELLTEWVHAALAMNTAAAIERAQYEVGRVTHKDRRVELLDLMLRAARVAAQGDGEGALVILGTLPRHEDLAVQQRWWTVRVGAALRAGVDSLATVVEEALAWAADKPPEARAAAKGWLGLLRSHQGRHDEAAALELEAARGREHSIGRHSALLNAAAALIWAFRTDEAVVVCREVLRDACAERNTGWEGRAECLLRLARYRGGADLEPDLELVDALEHLGHPDLTGLAALNEAAVAWRRGDLAVAARLADLGERSYRETRLSSAEILARSLRLACTGPHPPDALAECWEQALFRASDPLCVQALGLLLRAGGAVRTDWVEMARRQVEPQPRDSLHHRQEVLSLAEVMV